MHNLTGLKNAKCTQVDRHVIPARIRTKFYPRFWRIRSFLAIWHKCLHWRTRTLFVDGVSTLISSRFRTAGFCSILTVWTALDDLSVSISEGCESFSVKLSLVKTTGIRLIFVIILPSPTFHSSSEKDLPAAVEFLKACCIRRPRYLQECVIINNLSEIKLISGYSLNWIEWNDTINSR